MGRISYGLYLWHYPLFLWLDPARTGLSGGGLLALRVAASLLVAIGSFYLIERPIRRGALLRGWTGLASAAGALGATAVLVLGASAASSGAALVLPTTAQVGAQATVGADPIRVYVTGDSLGLTLAVVMGDPAMLQKYHVELRNRGVLGCGVVRSDESELDGNFYPTVDGCQLHPTFGHPLVADLVGQEEARWKPDVVVVLAGRWEVDNLMMNGVVTNILQPSFQALVRQGLEREVSMARMSGAKVLLVTQPCADSGTQPDGSPWPQDSLERLDIYNHLLRQVAAEHPDSVNVFDLNSLLCPGDIYRSSIRGVTVRTTDGIHLAVTGQPVIDPAIFPILARLGAERRAAAQSPR